MRERYQFALRIAHLAGHNTLQYFRKDFTVITKDDDSPVTDADRTSEELLRAEIEQHYPDDGIIGEEFGEKKGSSDFTWVLDPIDGTKSFVRGFPGYGNLVGMLENGEPTIGVINCPALGEMVSAYRGGGCFLNGRPCRVSQTAAISRATVCSSDFRDVARTWGPQTLLNIWESCGLPRSWGDCYGYLLLATGRIDIMIDPELKIWDLAALIPVILEAGGRITDLDGKTSVYNTSCVATNGIIHPDVLRVLR